MLVSLSAIERLQDAWTNAIITLILMVIFAGYPRQVREDRKMNQHWQVSLYHSSMRGATP